MSRVATSPAKKTLIHGKLLTEIPVGNTQQKLHSMAENIAKLLANLLRDNETMEKQVYFLLLQCVVRKPCEQLGLSCTQGAVLQLRAMP